MNRQNAEPQRRWGDSPHDILWWGKLAAAVAAICTLAGMALAFGYREISAPILTRVDSIAVRDSVRWEAERAARIAGDGKVEEKLDIVIGLLRGGRRGR